MGRSDYMKFVRTAAAVVALGAALSLPVAAPAGAQNAGACAGRSGGSAQSGGTGIVQAAPRQSGGQALGGLIDVAVQNVQALNDVTALNNVLNNAVTGNNIQVLCLNDVLNGNQTNLLSDILNNSNVLSNNRDVLSNNTVLQGFLNDNNIANGLQVLAVNTGNTRVGGAPAQLLSAEAQQSGPVTVYLFNPRGDDNSSGNRGNDNNDSNNRGNDNNGSNNRGNNGPGNNNR
jgi:hypothetical protein